MAWRGSRGPKTEEERAEWVVAVGADGGDLLAAVQQPTAPAEVRDLEVVQQLALVWEQQYEHDASGWHWRAQEVRVPAAERVVTPHDPEARYSEKRGRGWEGYKVHFTETCEADRPRLLTDVAVTAATQPDGATLKTIQAELARRHCLPGQHLVDAGYVAGWTLADSQQLYQVELVGPAPVDLSWQARESPGFTAEHFALDWVHQQATCPTGQRATGWSTSQDEHGHPVVQIRFPAVACQACASRSRCTRSAEGRSLRLRPDFTFLAAARRRQQAEAFWQTYAGRAGIEGTIAEAVRHHGARISRYIGQAKTWLQETLLAAAINLERAARWLMGERPKTTRLSHFMALAPVRNTAS